MSFKGTNLRMVNEDTSKGINGVSALSDIPDGYMLEAYNVDLSEPGKVKKRAGYNLHGCRLPVRTKSATIANPYSTGSTFVLDNVVTDVVNLDIFSNTGLNSTALNDSTIFQVDDSQNTVFVSFLWPTFTPGESVVTPITTDTIIYVRQGSLASPAYRPYRPIKVYDDGTVSGGPKFLLPFQMVLGFSPVPAISDFSSVSAEALLCNGYSFNRLPVEDITSVVVDNTGSYKTGTITFKAGSDLANLSVYTLLNFETGVRSNGSAYNGVPATVTAVTSTTLAFECSDATVTTLGSISLSNLSILYTEAKHILYVGANPNRTYLSTGPIYITGGPGGYQAIIRNCITYINYQNQLYEVSLDSTAKDETGFLYGFEVDVGYVNLLNKVYQASTGEEVLVTGYSGSLFVETAQPAIDTFQTLQGLKYVGASTVLSAASDRITIPLTDADKVYLAGDVVTLQYSTDTLGTLVTNSFTVVSASSTQLIVNAAGLPKLTIKTNTTINFRRTSSRIYLNAALKPSYYFKDMTVQYGESNASLPVYRVKNIHLPSGTGYANFLDLDTEITWESGVYLYSGNLFLPVFPEGITAPINTNYLLTDIVDYNSVEIDRSLIIAARENGMWRYNGSQLLNMRIPRPPSGFIRNIRGTNGYLAIDRGDDGLLTGRQYDFIVTYSYVELVNGKLVTYESGLSPIGAYSIVSEPATDLSGDSQLVELQVPTIPLGIGLPATSMFINVYRTKSGRLSTQASSEIYLLERQVVNNPYQPYQTILAGTEPPFLFNEENYKVLYASVQTDIVQDELAREIIDPPLASLVTALENRVIAANGEELPYVNLICKSVFDASTSSFAAGALLTYSPPLGSVINFATAALNPATTSGTIADGLGGTINFQAVGVPKYNVSVISYTDNSHLFQITGATVVVGTKYLLRFAAGRQEAKKAGTKDPFYDGFGFEQQTFVGTNAATAEVAAQKKWVTKTAAGTVITPTETFIVFQESQKIENVAGDNGLIITGNAGATTTESDVAVFTLKVKGSSTTYSVGDYLILKGLGTTGQVKDADGSVLDFDTDIVCEVTAANTAGDPDLYTLAICVMSNDTAGNTAYKRITVKSALSVSNLSSGVTHPPFVIYVRQSATARAVTNFTLPAATAAVTITTTPALTINAGDDIIIDGLVGDIPKGSGANWNRKYDAVSYNAGTGVFTLTAPKMPEELRGTVGTTLGASDYGKLAIPKNIFSYGTPSAGTNYLRIVLDTTTLSFNMAIGGIAYVIVRGREDDSYFPAFTGWFRITKLRNNALAWVDQILSGQNITGIEVDLQIPNAYLPTLSFDTMTGCSETKVVFCASSISAIVPVPTAQNPNTYLTDLTGTMYGPADGFTPLEKVIKRFAHAINFVLHDKVFAYWGGRRIGNDEASHPSNVLPTNGLKILSHLYPVNLQTFRYPTTAGTPTTNREPEWLLYGPVGVYRIEGEVRADSLTIALSRTTFTAKEKRPSRVWYTNPTGTLVGQAFRELSFDEVESQDGESIRALAPMQTFGLLFKKSSSWRIAFNNGATLVKDRIPSTVGASSAKNVVTTPKGAFVLHDSGIYITDGGTMEDVLQPSRIFKDRVAQNVSLLPFTAGYHNPFTKTVYLGIPLSADKSSQTGVVDAQFVFNYSNRSITLYSIDTGWSVNTQIPATFWVRVLSESYFASTEGKVFKLRREKSKTAYSDERSAIPFRIRTRYVDSQDPVGVRFYRSIFFQFGTETTNTMEVAIAYDFSSNYTHISSFAVDTSEAVNAVATISLNDKLIDVVRRTPPMPRAANISLEITNEELDTAAEVHGIFFESSDGSTKLVSQPGT